MYPKKSVKIGREIMKKSRKIFAGIAMGMMLAGGTMLTTGCTDINLTQDQTNKILQVVDNCDDFMNKTMNILEEQNNTIDARQAAKMYEMAVAKLELNYDNVWSGLKVKETLTGRNVKYQSNSVIFTSFIKENGYGLLNIVRDTDNDGEFENRTFMDFEELENASTDESEGSIITESKTFDYEMNSQLQGLFGLTKVTEDNILKIEKLENGDYKIFTIDEVGDSKLISECLIDSNGNLLYKDYYGLARMSPAEKDMSIVHVVVTVEYNAVTLLDFV